MLMFLKSVSWTSSMHCFSEESVFVALYLWQRCAIPRCVAINIIVCFYTSTLVIKFILVTSRVSLWEWIMGFTMNFDLCLGKQGCVCCRYCKEQLVLAKSSYFFIVMNLNLQSVLNGMPQQTMYHEVMIRNIFPFHATEQNNSQTNESVLFRKSKTYHTISVVWFSNWLVES